jgi:hypothetical protein
MLYCADVVLLQHDGFASRKPRHPALITQAIHEKIDWPQPKTREELKIAASRVAAFKPGAALKAAVNRGRK